MDIVSLHADGVRVNGKLISEAVPTLSWWCKWCSEHWPRDPHNEYVAAYATHVKEAHPAEAWWLTNCGCTIR